jgi:hypothetical protein
MATVNDDMLWRYACGALDCFEQHFVVLEWELPIVGCYDSELFLAIGEH